MLTSLGKFSVEHSRESETNFELEEYFLLQKIEYSRSTTDLFYIL